MSDEHSGNSAMRTLILPLLLGAVEVGALAFGIHSALQPPEAAAPAQASATAQVAAAAGGDFQPPPESAIPSGPDGDSIRRGMEIFLHTGTSTAKQFVGSSLTCGNCHLDGGRTANASPMWAAWVNYPAYRAKNGTINTMEDRIRGCFTYSMNAQDGPAGQPPPYGSDVYRDLEMYFAWLATGAPVGTQLKGRGYLKLDKPASFDLANGAKVFTANCAACHGDDGQGMKNPDGTYAFPPLWGPHSFNWGAGMGQVANAAGFIRANMPFGSGYSISEKDSWDVAAFVDSHERPPDPRQKGTTIAATQKAHHQSGDYYGQTVGGDLLGDGKS